MKRVVVKPRESYDEILDSQNLWNHNEAALNWTSCEKQPYWNEEGMVELSKKAEAEMMSATWELHNMAMEAVDLVVDDPILLKLFHINENLWPAMKKGWDRNKPDLLGRFDFSWDG